MLVQIESADHRLLDSICASMSEAVRRSGDWLACRIGCTQCCIGPFAITQLDALRLREGMSALQATGPARAAAVRARAESYVRSIGAIYPGNPGTGELFDEDALPASMDEFACPALDPDTGACDLYSARPMTCRTFGPPVRSGPEGGLGVCELCYHGASDQQIATCEMTPDPDNVEQSLLEEVERDTGTRGNTIVAFCLR